MSEETIFRHDNSKKDLETALWKLDHRLRAADYHAQRVDLLVQEVRERLHEQARAKSPAGVVATGEIVVSDTPVPFELEAFFYAGRSALDYFAQVVSRYVRGYDFSSMSKLGPFASQQRAKAPFWDYLAEEWDGWLKDFIEYRDDLIHRVVVKTSAAHTWSSRPNPSFGESKKPPFVETTEALFLVPRTLNKSMSICRWDILGWHPAFDADDVMPPGTSRVSMSGYAAIDGVVVDEWKQDGYKILPGVVPASELVLELRDRLLGLVSATIDLLAEYNFGHVPHE